MRIAHPCLSIATAAAFLACGTRTQVPADHAVIATQLPGAPNTQLLLVDLATSAVTTVSGFPHDNLRPLALKVDPTNRDVLLAVDLGGGASRILRLAIDGASVTRERVLADVVGAVSDLVVTYPGNIAISVNHAQGGLLLMPRNGGTPTSIISAPNVVGATNMNSWSNELWLAETGSPGTPAQVRLVGVSTGVIAGPFPLPVIQPPDLTGIAEMLSSIPSHSIGTASGAIWLHVLQTNPRQLPITPALPAGATNCVRIRFANQGLALGGSAHPFLVSYDAYELAPQTWNFLTGPLPGNPVSFDISARESANIAQFGERCSPSGTSPSAYTQGGFPQIGNLQFGVLTQGIPQVNAILVLGSSDQDFFGLPLPAALPGGGCELLVAADIVALSMPTDAQGRASRSLPIPANSGLNGRVVFAQWVHLIGGPLVAATDGLALHVFP